MLAAGNRRSALLTARTYLALALTGSLILAAAGVGTSALGSTAAAVPTRLHIGPVPVHVGERAVLAATNLSKSKQPVTLALIDDEGNRVARRQVVLPPRQTRLLGVQVDTSPIEVRGLVGTDSGFEGTTALSVLDGDGNTILFADQAVPQGELLTGRGASSMILGGEGDEFLGLVTNLGADDATFRIRFFDAGGNVLSTTQLPLAPGTTGSASHVLTASMGVRVVVLGPADAPYIATLTTQGGDGLLLGNILTG